MKRVSPQIDAQKAGRKGVVESLSCAFKCTRNGSCGGLAYSAWRNGIAYIVAGRGRSTAFFPDNKDRVLITACPEIDRSIPRTSANPPEASPAVPDRLDSTGRRPWCFEEGEMNKRLTRVERQNNGDSVVHPYSHPISYLADPSSMPSGDLVPKNQETPPPLTGSLLFSPFACKPGNYNLCSVPASAVD